MTVKQKVASATPPAPSPKVAASGIAGAVTVVIVYAASQAGLSITPEVASAITVIVSFIAGYVKAP